MAIIGRTISTTSRSVWLRRIDPTAIPPSAVAWQNLALTAIGNAAARETFMTATPHMASIWTDLFHSILAPSQQLRWKDDGPGLGRDAKSAYSSLLGRYTARAYLTAFEGVRVMVPLDLAKRWLHGTPFQIRKDPSGNGLEADWVGLDAHGLVIVEAKGSHDKAVRAWRGPSGIPSVLQSAIGQTERTAVFVRASNRKLPSKRWAIASRWGTQENGRDPTLIAWDPEDGKLDEEDYRSLARVFLQADMQAVAAGMGYTGGGGAFGVVGDFGRKPTIEEGLSIRLKVGERHIAPGLAVVLGPFGALPIRSAKDLLRIRQAREISPKIALVSLSTKYIQSVREGEHPVEDPLYTEDRAASQGGLTVIWPHEKEEVQIDE